MIVLDTNVVSESSKPRPNLHVLKWLERQPVEEVYLCAPTIMEQYYGAEKAMLKQGSDRYLRVAEDHVSRKFRDRLLPFAYPADRLSGRLRAERESRGRPISVGDAMIAAICIVHGATLATRNVRDFDGLDLELVNPFEVAA
jgi:predicted nucleic acid-binding protein